MLVHLVLLVMLSSGSIFGAVALNQQYEKTLPIYMISIILVLYISGLLGLLYYGFILTVIISGALIIGSVVTLMRKKNVKDSFRNLVSPGVFLFLIAYLSFTWLDYARLNSTYDEFTHWADSVKVMVIWDDFVTNPAAKSMFPNYPPGEALLQYFVQKLYLLFEPQSAFSEWRLYFTRHIFYVALALPFFSRFRWKDILYALIFMGGLLCLPLFLFNDYHSSFYTSLYIDGFLGACAGIGFAMVLFWKHKDAYYRINVMLLIALLTLLKQAGIILAVFLAVLYLLDELLINQPTSRHCRWKTAFWACLSVILPYVSWLLKLNQTKANSLFQPTLDIPRLLTVGLNQDKSFAADVWNKFFNAFFTRSVSIGSTALSVSYPLLLLIMLAVFIAVIFAIYRIERNLKKVMMLYTATIAALCFTYIVGMAVLYIVQFSEEALVLASFDRYIRIIYQVLSTINLFGMICLFHESVKKKWLILLISIMVLAIATPWENVSNVITRKSVATSVAWRTPLDACCDDLMRVSKDKNAKVFIIAQETTGNEYLAMRYYLRPYDSNPWGSWSICKPGTDMEGWTQEYISADDWATDLFSNYDYLLLYKVNEEFVESYSSLFSDPSCIQDRAIFAVDKQSRTLIAQ